MANVYESDSFNIEKVILGPSQSFIAEVQRLPTSTYPQKTQVHIPFSEFDFNIDVEGDNWSDANAATNRTNAAALSKSAFLAVAQTFITSGFANDDATYDGTPATLDDLSSETSLF